MNIYDEKGYLIIDKLNALNTTFNLITGGRGTGKTFGLLEYAIDHGIKYIYLRRTQSIVDLISSDDYSPLKSLARVKGLECATKKINKYVSAHYIGDSPEPVGYCMALSTFSNVRGFDSTDIKWIIYDEYIPERNSRPIKGEGDAFLNCYETINRNRELDGEKPVKVWCAGNANNPSNPIFISLGVVNIARRAQEKKREITILRDRSISYINLVDSPISLAKKETALYKASKNAQFNAMSLDNTFGRVSEDIKSVNLKGLNCIAAFDDIFAIYVLKNGGYYISEHVSGTPAIYTTSDIDVKRFKIKYRKVMSAYARNTLTFESDFCLSVFASILT